MSSELVWRRPCAHDEMGKHLRKCGDECHSPCMPCPGGSEVVLDPDKWLNIRVGGMVWQRASVRDVLEALDGETE